MKIYKDRSASLDKWDIRALSELLRKTKSDKGTFKDTEVNQMREQIMKTSIHRFWYWLKYPIIK